MYVFVDVQFELIFVSVSFSINKYCISKNTPIQHQSKMIYVHLHSKDLFQDL